MFFTARTRTLTCECTNNRAGSQLKSVHVPKVHTTYKPYLTINHLPNDNLRINLYWKPKSTSCIYLLIMLCLHTFYHDSRDFHVNEIVFCFNGDRILVQLQELFMNYFLNLNLDIMLWSSFLNNSNQKIRKQNLV